MNASVNELLYAGAVRIDMDSTSLVVLALFTLLFFTLRKLVFHPFLEDTDLRESKTVKMRETAKELEARASELQEKHRSAVESATLEAQQARRELRVAGLHNKEDRVSKAQSEAQASYDEQSEKLSAQFVSARESALSQADDIAKSIASKVLGRAVVWLMALGTSSYVFVSEAFAGGDAHGESTYLFDLANQSASLLLLVGLIIYFAGGSIKSGLVNRAESIAQEIEAAKSAHDKAHKLLNTYEEMINAFETERESLLATYRAQGEEEKAKLIEEGKAEAERVAKDAKRTAENEFAAMQNKIERELVDVSLARAEELIVKKINITDHTRLTQSYLSELDKIARG
jgi:F-type H+-transporting ATPase subunit b